jgi:hypothetical protein
MHKPLKVRLLHLGIVLSRALSKKTFTVRIDEINPLRYVRANTRKKKKRPLRHVRVLCTELRQTREGAEHEHAHAVTACSRTQLSSLATPPPTNNPYPPVTSAPVIALSLSLSLSLSVPSIALSLTDLHSLLYQQHRHGATPRGLSLCIFTCICVVP